MLTRPIAVVGLATAVIVAAAAGTYLAVRQNAAEVGRVAVNAGAPSGDPVAAPADLPVEATDETVEPEAPAPAETASARSSQAAPVAAAPAETRPAAVPTPTPPPPAPEPIPAPAPVVSPPPPPAAPERAVVPAEPIAIAGPAEPAAPAPPTVSADLPRVEGWSRPAGAGTPEGPDDTDRARTTAAPAGTRVTRVPDLPAPPPAPIADELEIAADSVIGLQVDTPVSTRTAKVEDTVEARVTRDVQVAERVAVPAGTRMLGSVTLVEQGGKLRDASRIGVRFHTLVMSDGTRVPVSTETIYREGDSRGDDSVAKIGGAAVGGAILGALLGGGRGAAIGGSIGAAGGTAAALSGEAEPAGFPPGTRLTVRLSRPAIVPVQ